MTRLLLMRHGNTFEEGKQTVQVGLRTDLPLTAFGRNQAQLVAQALQKKPPQIIFAGRLKRQIESAQIIADLLGVAVQQTPALNEIDYGLWEGLTAAAISQQWPKEYAEWNKQAKWQDNIFQGTFEKHWDALQKWLATLQNFETVLGVTSNGLLRFFKNEKVKTGHLCELFLHSDRIEIGFWNQSQDRLSQLALS